MSETNNTIKSESLTPILKCARLYAPDYYLSALLAPSKTRNDLITLAAFIGDVQRIVSTLSDPMIAEIRLQWWRDQLQGIHSGGMSGNPIADALSKTIVNHDLDPGKFIDFLDAKTTELQPVPFATEHNYLVHLNTGDVQTFALIAQVLGIEQTPKRRDFLTYAGTAYGITRTLRALRNEAEHGRWALPLAWSNLDSRAEPPLAPSAAKERHKACTQAVKKAREALKRARRTSKMVPRSIISAVLPAALVEPHLKAFDSHECDPLMVDAHMAPLARIWKLWWAHTRGIL